MFLVVLFLIAPFAINYNAVVCTTGLLPYPATTAALALVRPSPDFKAKPADSDVVEYGVDPNMTFQRWWEKHSTYEPFLLWGNRISGTTTKPSQANLLARWSPGGKVYNALISSESKEAAREGIAFSKMKPTDSLGEYDTHSDFERSTPIYKGRSTRLLYYTKGALRTTWSNDMTTGTGTYTTEEPTTEITTTTRRVTKTLTPYDMFELFHMGFDRIANANNTYEKDDETLGKFGTLLDKFFNLMELNKPEDALRLYMILDMVIDDMKNASKILMDLSPLERIVRSSFAADADTRKRRVALLKETILARNSSGHHHVNAIINLMDRAYLPQESEALFASLVGLQEFPENQRPSDEVLLAVVTAFMAPFNRLKHSGLLDTILGLLNKIIAGNLFPRKSLQGNVNAIMPKRSNKPHELINANTFTKWAEWNARTREPFVYNTFTKWAEQNSITHDLSEQIYDESHETLQDIDSTFHKYNKPQKFHNKEHVKYITNKHTTIYHELYRYYRNTYKINKEKQTNRFYGHNYEKLMRTRYKVIPQAVEDNTVVTKQRELTKSMYMLLQKSYGGFTTLSRHKKSIEQLNKINTKRSNKIRSPATEKTKKSIYINNLRIGKPDIFVKTKKTFKIKNRLGDTLLGRHKMFIKRNANRARKSIRDLSSYSDEELVLKNNIYKVFGYTAHL